MRESESGGSSRSANGGGGGGGRTSPPTSNSPPPSCPFSAFASSPPSSSTAATPAGGHHHGRQTRGAAAAVLPGVAGSDPRGISSGSGPGPGPGLFMGRRASHLRRLLRGASERTLPPSPGPRTSEDRPHRRLSQHRQPARRADHAAAATAAVAHRYAHLMEEEEKKEGGDGGGNGGGNRGGNRGGCGDRQRLEEAGRAKSTPALAAAAATWTTTTTTTTTTKKEKEKRKSIIADGSVMGGMVRPPPPGRQLRAQRTQQRGGKTSGAGAAGPSSSASRGHSEGKEKVPRRGGGGLSDLVASKAKLRSAAAKNRVRFGAFPASEPRPELGDGHGDGDGDGDGDAGDGGDRGSPAESDMPPPYAPTPFHIPTTAPAADGSGSGSVNNNESRRKADVRDVGTPDGWIVRHGSLERLSGRHPFNAEALLPDLRAGGFLTPGHLHFVRNHGAVPKLNWEDHRLEVQVGAAYVGDPGIVASAAASGSSGSGSGSGSRLQEANGGPSPPPPVSKKPRPLNLSMDELTALPAVELPVTVTCIGNRRAELNAIRRSIGFSWGAGATSTSVYRGVSLRSLLLKAGVSDVPSSWEGCHVDFTGSDVLPNKVGPGPFVDEGNEWGPSMEYGTSVPLGKAMDPARDIMIAYQQNGERLGPDHGYPVRVVVPGCTGGRMVKWLRRIEVMPHESRNLYHYHDNKILPPQVVDLETSQDKEKRWWYKNEYIVHELNINSAVWVPGHGDTLDVDLDLAGAATEEEEEQQQQQQQQQARFTVSGYAYAGGGRRVNRVELSLDAGSTWSPADLDRPAPSTPHDMSWCWIFWSASVGTADLVSSDEIVVRAWDESNNVQPMMPTWNLMGLGNNPAFRVKIRKTQDDVDLVGGMAGRRVRLTFDHPCQPGGLPGGWMKEPGGLPDSAGFGPLVDLAPKEDEDEDEDEDEEATGAAAEAAAAKEIRIITEEEVEESVAQGKIWIVINGGVYDCDEYLKTHPGGPQSIEIYKGKDCTKDFAAVHSLGATKLLRQYHIGNLDGGGVEQQEKNEGANIDDEMRKIMEELDEEEVNNPALVQAERTLDELYGVAAAGGGEEGDVTEGDGVLDPADAVIIMGWWADIVAKGEEAFTEALLWRWRVLAAVAERSKQARSKRVDSAGVDADNEDSDEDEAIRAAKLKREATVEVNASEDVLARCLGGRLYYTNKLLIGFLDATVGSLYSSSWRRVPRYDEQDLAAVGMLEGTRDAYARLFNSCGLEPGHWVLFCDAFLWAVETHAGFEMQGDNKERIEAADNKERIEAAYAAFISDRVARFIIRSQRIMKAEFLSPACLVLRKIGRHMRTAGDELRETFGQAFYQTLFASHPFMLDYFPKTNMDDQALHALEAMLLVVDTMDNMLESESSWHRRCQKLDKIHVIHSIPTYTYQTNGGSGLKAMKPLFEQQVEMHKNGEFAVTLEELEDAFSALYFVTAGRVQSNMVYYEMIMAEAEGFWKNISKELDWSEEDRNDRLLHLKMELTSGADVEHTTEELKAGARLAWRNSAETFVRDSWKDLVVLDRRHMDTSKAACKAIDELLQAASSKEEGSPKCVLTVLCPSSLNPSWGLRFWAHYFFEYAGYEDEDRTVLGNSANIERTEHLVRHGLWTPPERKSDFDLLPVVIKTPGHLPFAYTIPESLRHEVLIEHPSCSGIASLGVRWPAFAIACNQKLRTGGIEYECCAFSRCFLVTEVVRGLSKWPTLLRRWAEIMEISTTGLRFQKRVQYEIEEAVLYSFRKQGYTILDEEEASLSFATHSKREMEAGRECPGKGGIMSGGMHRVSPRFEHSCDAWKVTDVAFLHGSVHGSLDVSLHGGGDEVLNLPKPLILYGSETGTSEGAAFGLKRALKLLNPIVMTLNEAAGLNILQEERDITHIVVICCTFNRGEFPHNAKLFAHTPLAPNVIEGKKFSVLALGSTVYPDFCRSGIRLDDMLAQAGGKAFVSLTKVDGSSGSAGPISDWLQLVQDIILPQHLVEAIRGPDAEVEEVPARYETRWLQDEGPKTDQLEQYSWGEEEETFLCLSNDELMDEGDINTRSTRRIAFRLPPGCTYESGDHLAVNPLNSLDMVRRFAVCFMSEMKDAAACPNNSAIDDASILALQLQQPFDIECFEGEEKVEPQLPFSTPATLSDVLQAQIDLTLHGGEVTNLIALVTKAIFGADGKLKNGLADHVDSIKEIEDAHVAIVKKKGGERQYAIDSFLSKYPTIVDFLETFQFLCKPLPSAENSRGALVELAEILSVLSRLQSRYYSISSSPKTDSSVVAISVGVVHVTTSAETAIHGVCSNYLARLRPSSDRVKVSVRTSSFRGPADANYPMLMVGPGTGLAPMMGFLEDRAVNLSTVSPKPGTCHLFFGCRTLKDRIYSDEIDKWESDKVLSHHLALSRSADMPKTYVQDLLLNMGKELYDILMDEHLHIYVCGDAKVANACFEVCVETLRVYGNKSRVSAVRHVKLMRAEKRFQCDLWGTLKRFEEVRGSKKIAKKILRAKQWLKNFE